MSDKKNYHFEGLTDRGDAVLRECGTEKTIRARPHRPGTAIPMGTGYAVVSPLSDGRVEVDTQVNPDGTVTPDDAPVLSGSGPAKVASDDYRDGWDRIFGGNNSVN